MEAYKREFIQFLQDAGVLKFGDFTAKSGRKIPYFVNAGMIKTGDQITKMGEFYAKAYFDKLGKKQAVLYGPAYKGISLSISAAVALSKNGLNVPFFFNRKEVKDHGEGGMFVPDSAQFVYSYKQEMFLSEDAKTVTLIYPYRNKDGETVVSIEAIDVSSPGEIREASSVQIYGSYLSSRLTDGKLLVISSYRPESPNYKKPETFVPKVDTGDGIEVLPLDSITYPDELSSTTYTVVTSLDAATLNVDGTHAFLSYSENLYVSENAIYATRGYTDPTETEGGKTYTTKSNISKLSYADGKLEFVGTFTVDGTVNDQYSLDENDGVLRVVTTTNKYGAGIQNLGTNASLYCIDATTFEVIAKVESFAPWGETVRSVRFDGDAAYVCTSIQLTDPVFFFDLSDLENITYTDTGTIDGFSTSLINFGNGFLVGIGVGSLSSTLKIEVYTEEGGVVVPLCAYELENTYYSTEYKSYYVDRKNQLIGLGVRSYSGEKFNDKGGTGYILLSFDGFALHELLAVTVDGEPSNMRGVYIDDCFYILSKDNLIVKKIS